MRCLIFVCAVLWGCEAAAPIEQLALDAKPNERRCTLYLYAALLVRSSCTYRATNEGAAQVFLKTNQDIAVSTLVKTETYGTQRQFSCAYVKDTMCELARASAGEDAMKRAGLAKCAGAAERVCQEYVSRFATGQLSFLKDKVIGAEDAQCVFSGLECKVEEEENLGC